MQFLEVPNLSSAIAVLTAMITPAVLISACGSLILSTITRLARAIDRVRALLDRLEELSKADPEIELLEERRETIYKQLEMATRRNRLLQQSMVALYLALGAFVATTVTIGVVAVTGHGYEWLPAVLGLIGACFLGYSSVVLIMETQISSASLALEMNFILRLSKQFVPKNIVDDVGKISMVNFPKFRRKKKETE
jgi:Protein of unknown function (DUF2721)